MTHNYRGIAFACGRGFVYNPPEMDEHAIAILADELRALGGERPVQLLNIVVTRAQAAKLDWRQTLLLVERMEKLVGVKLFPLKFGD